MRLITSSVCLALLLFGCGGETAGPAGAASEEDLYRAIARSEVRYVLLTRSEGKAEARTASNESIVVSGVEDLDALAAVLSKERIEYHLQEDRTATMLE